MEVLGFWNDGLASFFIANISAGQGRAARPEYGR